MGCPGVEHAVNPSLEASVRYLWCQDLHTGTAHWLGGRFRMPKGTFHFWIMLMLLVNGGIAKLVKVIGGQSGICK